MTPVERDANVNGSTGDSFALGLGYDPRRIRSLRPRMRSTPDPSLRLEGACAQDDAGQEGCKCDGSTPTSLRLRARVRSAPDPSLRLEGACAQDDAGQEGCKCERFHGRLLRLGARVRSTRDSFAPAADAVPRK